MPKVRSVNYTDNTLTLFRRILTSLTGRPTVKGRCLTQLENSIPEELQRLEKWQDVQGEKYQEASELRMKDDFYYEMVPGRRSPLRPVLEVLSINLSKFSQDGSGRQGIHWEISPRDRGFGSDVDTRGGTSQYSFRFS